MFLSWTLGTSKIRAAREAAQAEKSRKLDEEGARSLVDKLLDFPKAIFSLVIKHPFLVAQSFTESVCLVYLKQNEPCYGKRTRTCGIRSR